MSTYIVYPTIEQEKALRKFLETHDIPFEVEDEVLPPHVLEGIAKGMEDIKAGRTITLEEFKRKHLRSLNDKEEQD